MTEEHAAAHAELRGRVTELVRGLEPGAVDAPSPATPGWRARDVLAHMVGVSDDVVNGRMEGLASDPWTAAQVDKRRDLPIKEVLAEWDEQGRQFETMLAAGPEQITGQALFDALTHEHDIRHAVARPGARDSRAVTLGWEWAVGVRRATEERAIRFVTEHGEEIAGRGEPCVTITAPVFELVRACTGRRTENEIAGYGWEPGPPDTSLLILAPFFTIRTEPLGE